MSNYKIIMVGEDNLTRSIVAEAVLKKILLSKNIDNIEVLSRGLVVLFSEPISPKASAVLHEHGCDAMTRRSAEITQEDVEGADLILTITKMDVEHFKEHFECQATCMFLGTFIDMEEELPPIEEDTKEAYEACYQATKIAMEAVADRLILEVMTP